MNPIQKKFFLDNQNKSLKCDGFLLKLFELLVSALQPHHLSYDKAWNQAKDVSEFLQPYHVLTNTSQNTRKQLKTKTWIYPLHKKYHLWPTQKRNTTKTNVSCQKEWRQTRVGHPTTFSLKHTAKPNVTPPSSQSSSFFMRKWPHNSNLIEQTLPDTLIPAPHSPKPVLVTPCLQQTNLFTRNNKKTGIYATWLNMNPPSLFWMGGRIFSPYFLNGGKDFPPHFFEWGERLFPPFFWIGGKVFPPIFLIRGYIFPPYYFNRGEALILLNPPLIILNGGKQPEIFLKKYFQIFWLKSWLRYENMLWIIYHLHHLKNT